jgi:hypothetical protein
MSTAEKGGGAYFRDDTVYNTLAERTNINALQMGHTCTCSRIVGGRL